MTAAGCLMLVQVYSSGKGMDINIDCHRAGAIYWGLLPVLLLCPAPCCTLWSSCPGLSAPANTHLQLSKP